MRSKFRDAIDRAEPNAGHHALAELEDMGILKQAITQNVDNLHHMDDSRLLAEIHGNRTKLRCIGCESRWLREEFRIHGYPPSCPEWSVLVKPNIVIFGQPVPRGVLDRCSQVTYYSDCMIAAGTSASVFPTANFPCRLLAQSGRVIETNLNHTPFSACCTRGSRWAARNS